MNLVVVTNRDLAILNKVFITDTNQA